MGHKIGEIFEYNGEWYQCVEGNDCANCVFIDYCKSHSKEERDSTIGLCVSFDRNDGMHVIFRKLEKVGEPYRRWLSPFNNIMVQRYRLYGRNVIMPDEPIMLLEPNYKNSVEIEIKQNKEDMGDNADIRPYDELFSPGTVSNTKYLAKEDMEEKKQCGDNRFEVIEKAKKHLLSSTNIESSKEEMKVLDNFLIRCWQMGWLKQYEGAEEKKLNLKPFDLQKAREGKPVCTRDGHKARIICFDRKDIKPIVALVTFINGTSVIEKAFYYFEDGYHLSKNDNNIYDLMMLPEEKEGWVNVYKGGLLDTKSYNTRKEAFDKSCPRDYVDTVKISWYE